jgi:hypothetical protein
MARAFKGQVHVRISPELHEEVAREAFDKDISISGIFAQALVARRILQGINPWRAIEATWAKNRGTNVEDLETDITKAVKAVRKSRG